MDLLKQKITKNVDTKSPSFFPILVLSLLSTFLARTSSRSTLSKSFKIYLKQFVALYAAFCCPILHKTFRNHQNQQKDKRSNSGIYKFTHCGTKVAILKS